MKPYFQRPGVTIWHGDSLEVLPLISSTDLIVTDPPYVFGIASTGQEGKAGGWADLMNSATWYAEILREFRRLLENREGAAWVFNSWRSFPVLARAGFMAQWPITSLLVWDKDCIGPGGAAGLRPSYELVALFSNPDFVLHNRSLPDVWRSKWPNVKPNHPAEKPVPLLERMIAESIPQARRAESIVLDPFMGSGSTLIAARRAGCLAVGIEAEERWCEVAAKRLSQGDLDFAAEPLEPEAIAFASPPIVG